MTDWLSKIEVARTISRRWGTMPEDMDRMARVIRELVNLITYMGDLEWRLRAYETTGNNLSDDGKELLGINKDYREAFEEALADHPDEIELFIDFSYCGLPREEVVEYAILPSGRIVAMDKQASYWFESDGTSPKGSYLVPWPAKKKNSDD